MIDFGFTFFVLVGGFVIGLVFGLARKHGLVWTLIDMVVAGVAAIAFVFLWFYGLGGIPFLREALNRIGKDIPPIGSALSFITLMTPLIGALIGLWIVSRLRRRMTAA
jgi:hypothetical protein